MKNQIVRSNGNPSKVSSTLARLTQISSRVADTIFGPEPEQDEMIEGQDNCLDFPAGNKTQVWASTGGSGGRVCYVLDVSGSMGSKCDSQTTKLQALKQACVVALNALSHSFPDSEVAVISFNHDAQVVCPFVNIEQGYRQIFSSIQNLQSGGCTDIPRALQVAEQLLGQSLATANDRLMLLTDGHGGDGSSVARNIKSRGSVISTIGFGRKPSAVNEKVLKRIASVENGRPLYEFANNRFALKTTVVNATRIKPV